MSVPKKKLSKTRTRSRRSHHAIDAPSSATCEKCSAIVQPHRACTECGNYRGKNVINTQKRVEKTLAAATAKESQE